MKVQRQTYTVTEMAGMLGLSVPTIYRRIAAGVIPVIRRDRGQGYRAPIDKFHEVYPDLRPLFQLSLPFPEPRPPRRVEAH